MKLSLAQLVLNNFQRALLAEEKQGFTNTGVLGGFNAFLRGILPRLGQLFPDHDLDLLKNLVQQYPTWSPLRRREAFAELRRFMQEISLEAQVILAQKEPFNADLKLLGKQDIAEEREEEQRLLAETASREMGKVYMEAVGTAINAIARAAVLEEKLRRAEKQIEELKAKPVE